MFSLGLDCSTQSLTAVVVESDGDRRSIAFECSFAFDEVLPQYGTRHGVLPSGDPAVAASPPLMWADALDTMMAKLAASGVDPGAIAAISGSAQQHGSVYLTSAFDQLDRIDAARSLATQMKGMFARDASPIWMDSSTSEECREIEAGVGGATALAQRTGSRAFERFTASQIRRFSKQQPDAYAATSQIHLVSSFLCSLLVGHSSPIDPGDASGMNLMDLATSTWWRAAVDATAPDLHRRLPPIVPASAVAGTLAPYWQQRYGLPAARVIVWSGDNPSSMIGTGLVREGRVAISLGTSDTLFGPMAAPRVDASGTGHVFAAPTGAFMGLTCWKNGSLARERIRDAYALSWESFSAALARTIPGNHGRVMLPWFDPEITPAVTAPGVRRYNLSQADVDANVRAVVEAQMLSMANHSAWMGVDVREIIATGGASVNRDILQVMADVFGVDVYRSSVTNSAALGAALRAMHGDRQASGDSIEWADVVRGLTDPIEAAPLRPDSRAHDVYRDAARLYAACEADALAHIVNRES